MGRTYQGGRFGDDDRRSVVAPCVDCGRASCATTFREGRPVVRRCGKHWAYDYRLRHDIPAGHAESRDAETS